MFLGRCYNNKRNILDILLSIVFFQKQHLGKRLFPPSGIKLGPLETVGFNRRSNEWN
jgi:hypothetical protein